MSFYHKIIMVFPIIPPVQTVVVFMQYICFHILYSSNHVCEVVRFTLAVCPCQKIYIFCWNYDIFVYWVAGCSTLSFFHKPLVTFIIYVCNFALIMLNKKMFFGVTSYYKNQPFFEDVTSVDCITFLKRQFAILNSLL